MSAERPFLKKSFAGIVEAALAELRSGHGGRVRLDDATEGSVLRTLVEAFGRELAVCYEQLEAVYQAGYLDTASGAALDEVVELLGVTRHQAGWLEGDVVFSRGTPAPFDIDIPAGTLIAGKRVQAFETLIPATLALGQSQARVPVRSLAPEGEVVPPGKITVLQRPIPGIEQVQNPGALLPRRDPESDDDLRVRARSAVRGGHSATVSALERAVMALGIVDVQVTEDPGRPGRVEVVLADDSLTDDEVAAVVRAVEEARSAGVRVDTYKATIVTVRVRVVIELDAELGAQAEAALRARLEAGLRSFFDGLGVNDSVRWNKVRNLLAAYPEVAEVALPEVPAGGPADPDDLSGWPLVPVHPDSGAPTSDARDRLLGSVDAPAGVFIRADERARLHQHIELDLRAPALPVWIDVDAVLAPGVDPDDLDEIRAELAQVMAALLPRGPLGAPLTMTWDDLSAHVAASVERVDENTLGFVILHDRDGRVVTLAQAADASERETFAVREVLSVRTIRVRAPGES